MPDGHLTVARLCAQFSGTGGVPVSVEAQSAVQTAIADTAPDSLVNSVVLSINETSSRKTAVVSILVQLSQGTNSTLSTQVTGCIPVPPPMYSTCTAPSRSLLPPYNTAAQCLVWHTLCNISHLWV